MSRNTINDVDARYNLWTSDVTNYNTDLKLFKKVQWNRKMKQILQENVTHPLDDEMIIGKKRHYGPFARMRLQQKLADRQKQQEAIAGEKHKVTNM